MLEIETLHLIVSSGRQRRAAVRVRPQVPPNRHHLVGHRLREGPLSRRLHEGGGLPRLDREDRPQILMGALQHIISIKAEEENENFTLDLNITLIDCPLSKSDTF